MARFITDVPTGYSPQEIHGILGQFMQVENFKFQEFRGENVYKKGTGWLAAPQCMKVDVYDGMVHIEAWIQSLLFPGVYLGEMDFEGPMAWAVKGVFKTRVNTLVQSIAAKPPMEKPLQHVQPAPPMQQQNI